MVHETIILIPARMGSTRLPGKPLADIAGRPMIVHVLERAREANIGEVYVACAEEAIAEVVRNAGGNAVLTSPDHPCGTDRIYEALQTIDKEKKVKRIVNVQGDLPTLDPTLIRDALTLLDDPNVDIGTLAAEITEPNETTNPNVVKAVFSLMPGKTSGRALYFTRAAAPSGEGKLYHHIGLYTYTRKALEKFVALPPSPLEQREKLEQLRALENGMRIDVACVKTVPLGVDTQEDLIKAQWLFGVA